MPDVADVGISGVVLAGGASRRFGSDKLAAEVEGMTLLGHAVRGLAERCDEVVVVLAPDAPVPEVGPTVSVARDRHAHHGPLSGLASGLATARGGLALVVGGDMPWLRPAVADLLLAGLEDPAVAVSALGDGGMARPMPIAVRRRAALAAAERLLGTGERRLRSLFEELPSAVVPEEEWRAADPAGWSLRDVDSPADLPDRGPALG